MLDRRSFLQATGLGMAALGCREALAAPGSAFRFVHLTDVHLQPELDAERGFRQCIAKINALTPRPAFVITGGDLIMDALEVDHQRCKLQWDMYQSCCQDFAMPAFHVVGNHDVVGWHPQRKVPTDHADYGKQMFADRVGQGATFRAFDHQGWRFFLLDSIGQSPTTQHYVGEIDQAQLDWLDRELRSLLPTTPIVLVSHIPFVCLYLQQTKGPEFDKNRMSTVSNGPAVLKRFEKHNLRLVLQGHIHVRERLDDTQTTYVMTGAVSGHWWKGPTHGKHPEGFGVVDCLSDGSFVTQFSDFGWQAKGT